MGKCDWEWIFFLSREIVGVGEKKLFDDFLIWINLLIKFAVALQQHFPCHHRRHHRSHPNLNQSKNTFLIWNGSVSLFILKKYIFLAGNAHSCLLNFLRKSVQLQLSCKLFVFDTCHHPHTQNIPNYCRFLFKHTFSSFSSSSALFLF